MGEIARGVAGVSDRDTVPARKGLGAFLRAMDSGSPRTRIFVMGCGRSGTWLLTGIMSTFEDVYLLAHEGPATRFADIVAEQRVHVAKRDHVAFGWINLVPYEIKILAIVRHPFDVLTSHNPNSTRKYHVAPLRWNLEMQALRWLVDTRRPGTLIVRYEDLAANPDGTQKAIAEFFKLRVCIPASEYERSFQAPRSAISAMHGLRRPDVHSIGRWKRDPESAAYIQGLAPFLRPQLDWVSAQFGYNTAL
jgi:hypothetical protein